MRTCVYGRYAPGVCPNCIPHRLLNPSWNECKSNTCKYKPINFPCQSNNLHVDLVSSYTTHHVLTSWSPATLLAPCPVSFCCFSVRLSVFLYAKYEDSQHNSRLKTKLTVNFTLRMAFGLHTFTFDFQTRLALTSVLGPFAVYLLEFILHWLPGALMHYSELEFHFKV